MNPIYRLYRFLTRPLYNIYNRKLWKEVKKGRKPKHIAIIMDGNRRFAKEWGMSETEGHTRGKDKLEEVMEWAMDMGIKVMTVYAFSTENFNRSPEEVKHLMKLFEDNFRKLAEEERIHKNRIRVSVLGQKELLPDSVKDAIDYAEEKTKDYDDYYYNLAVAYGGREEIISAIKRIARDVKNEKVEINDIDQEMFSSYLYTADFPDPDLILRTSGEERVSNFLLWQIAYSELYFVDVYWPGFRKVDFLRAIRSFQQRSRRFGN